MGGRRGTISTARGGLVRRQCCAWQEGLIVQQAEETVSTQEADLEGLHRNVRQIQASVVVIPADFLPQSLCVARSYCGFGSYPCAC